MNSKKAVLTAIVFHMAVLNVCMPAAYADKLDSWRSCCGAVCLRVVSGLLNDHHTLSDLRELLQPGPNGDVSLDEVLKTAKAMGFNAIGCRIHHEALARCTMPMVAHRKPHHFVVLVGLGQGRGVSIIDPPHESRQITEQELTGQEYWNVVVISDHPISMRGIGAPGRHLQTDGESQNAGEVKVANLRMSADSWDFGRVVEGTCKSHRFSITNVGQTPVLIETAKSNCACLTIDQWTRKLAPSETGVIDVTMDTSKLRGYLKRGAILSVKQEPDKEAQVLRLVVGGLVLPKPQLTIIPKVVELGEIAKGSIVDRTVKVRRLGFDPLGLVGVRSDSNMVQARQRGPSESPNDEVEIALSIAPVSLGSFAHKVAIQTNHKTHPTADVVVRGTVVPAMQCEPRELFLGVLREGSVAKSFKVQNVLNKPFRILKAQTDYPGIVCRSCGNHDTPQSVWEIQLTVKQPLPIGLIKGNIILETTDADVPTLKVPFIGWRS